MRAMDQHEDAELSLLEADMKTLGAMLRGGWCKVEQYTEAMVVITARRDKIINRIRNGGPYR